jgi:hypothetical protein
MQICLSFYETKNKHPSWFNKTERLFWEHWYVNLHVRQHTKAHSGKSHHSKPMVDLGGNITLMYQPDELLMLNPLIAEVFPP